MCIFTGKNRCSFRMFTICKPVFSNLKTNNIELITITHKKITVNRLGVALFLY